ncbi:MAG: 3-deoxy-7-phosphoheptulonate synthase [Polyangiaceae bacterium]
MIVTLKPGSDVAAAKSRLAGLGLWIDSVERSALGEVHLVVGRASTRVESATIEGLPEVLAVSQSGNNRPRMEAQGPRVEVRAGLAIDGAEPVLMAGPCSVESESQIHRIARKVRASGARLLRGGAFKPRTSPYDFQGYGKDAATWLRSAADAEGLAVVTEVMSEADVPLISNVADMLQVGSRNMQNFALLKAVGRAGRPVLLKRSMSATVDEWLHAGEYLLVHGASGVVFCERGIRGFDPSTRNLLDLGAVALIAKVFGMPVVVDPSHAAGRRDLVIPLAKAALAAGAAGLLIEVHDEPENAKSDGAQSVMPQALLGLGFVNEVQS